MESLKDLGGVDLVRLKAGADGATVDVGDLIVCPTHKLSGRVVISGNQHLPSDTVLYVTRLGLDTGGSDPYALYDRQGAMLAEDGSFEIKGLPNGLYDVFVARSLSSKVRSLPPYHLLTKNRNLDANTLSRLLGRVEHDTVITVGLEPGERELPEAANRTAADWARIKAALDQVLHSPLQGLPDEVGKTGGGQ